MRSQDLTARIAEDIYQGMDSTFIEHMCTHMALTLSQSLTIDYLYAIPNGLGIDTGPPETGKTHLVAQAVLPLIAFRKRRQALLLALHTNKGKPQNQCPLAAAVAVFSEKPSQP